MRDAGRSRFRALWDFSFLTGGETIGKLLGFIAFAYLARVLGPEKYGGIEVAFTLLSVFSLFVNFGLSPIGAREVAQNPEDKDHWAALMPGTRFMIVLVCVPAMCGVAAGMGLDREVRQLAWIMSLALIPLIWNQNWLLQGLERMGLVSVGQALRMATLVAGVLLLVRGPGDLLRVGLIEIVAAGVLASYFVFLQHRLKIPIRLSFDLKEISRLIRRGFSIGLSQVIWALNQYLSTLMVAFLLGGTAVAWFAAAHRIVNAIVGYSAIYHFNLFPAVAARLKESKAAFDDLIRPSFRVAAWGGIGIALAGTLAAERISVFVFGSEFRQAGLPMAVLMWCLPITLLAGHARWALIAIDEQRFVAIAHGCGVVTTILAGLLLIPRFGAVGASITMLASYTVVWLVAHVSGEFKIGRMPLAEIIRPGLLAAITIYAVSMLSGFSIPGIAGGLLFFAAVAPLVDRALIRDIQRISAIKSQPLS